MNTLLLFALLALAIWLLFLGRALLAWVLPFALGLGVWFVRAGGMTPGLWVCGVVFAALVLGLAVPLVRRTLVAPRLVPWMTELFPALEEEERAGLEGNAAGWAGALLRGEPSWKALFSRELPEAGPLDFAEGAPPPLSLEGSGEEALAAAAGGEYLVAAGRRFLAAERAEGGSLALALEGPWLDAEAQRLRGQEVPAAGDRVSRASELHRRALLLGHPYLRALREAIAERDTTRFDAAVFGCLGCLLSNFTRAALFGWSRGRLAPSPVEGEAERFVEHLTRLSAVLAVLADATLLDLGDAQRYRARQEARLADALAWLVLGSAALKRFADEEQRRRDEPLASWAVGHSLHRAQEALLAWLDNLPGRRTAWFLRWKLFPFHARFRAPSDELEARIVRALREREGT